MSLFVPSSLRAITLSQTPLVRNCSSRLTLVYNIPVRALALVSAHNLLDMVLHDAHQSSVVVDLVNPAGQLTVPDQRMAT